MADSRSRAADMCEFASKLRDFLRKMNDTFLINLSERAHLSIEQIAQLYQAKKEHISIKADLRQLLSAYFSNTSTTVLEVKPECRLNELRLGILRIKLERIRRREETVVEGMIGQEVYPELCTQLLEELNAIQADESWDVHYPPENYGDYDNYGGFACSYCGRWFPNGISLRRHQLVHPIQYRD